MWIRTTGGRLLNSALAEEIFVGEKSGRPLVAARLPGRQVSLADDADAMTMSVALSVRDMLDHRLRTGFPGSDMRELITEARMREA